MTIGFAKHYNNYCDIIFSQNSMDVLSWVDMDRVTKEVRSRNMVAIKSTNTKPEIFVRKVLYSGGYRYRLFSKDLPGKPDIVLNKYRTVIFINGCFWHQHEGCKQATRPKSNKRFWSQKLKRNCERDSEQYAKLEELGYKVVVIWECEISLADKSGSNKLKDKLFKKIGTSENI